ncbi:MAG: hypothetical protein A3G18_01665 [Rhodospirillales bacterium RIFCSPLOWO2_12_FULL_58_28]|nr:MAG: hypothetical protein A3H92_07855 [Rhodospirillales bacterium RIFCSPLOWO2_02_FULL_58_16]OHC79004.1 MAG: hypothetical protein A3G18_01665 [Rhodospirillales bacterium RIFCSPLOWO2_12_FULL_58_28]
MTAITFDTLEMARRLREEAHFTAEQAEGTARVLAESLSEVSGLATAGDIHRLEAKIDRLEAKIDQVELRMTARLGAMMVVAVGAVAAMVKLL